MNEKALSGRFIAGIILTGCLIVAGMLAAAALGIWGSLRQDRDAVARSLLASSQLIEQGTTRAFESVHVALKVLGQRSQSPAILAARTGSRSNSSVAARDMMTDIMRYSPHIRQMMVVDGHGTILLDSARARTASTGEEPAETLDLVALGLGQAAPSSVGGNFRVGVPVPGRFLGGDLTALPQVVVQPVSAAGGP